jgi:periplasmic copper chaperone A
MKPTSHRSMTRTACSLAALALLVPVLLAGCGNDDDSSATTTTAKAASSAPKVTDVWARPGTTGGNSAMYMTITGGSEEDQLTKVTISSDVVGTVELHETTKGGSSTSMVEGSSDMSTTTSTAMGETTTAMGGGMMGMQPVKEITIPAGGTVTLEPGGYHVMLMDLKKDLKAGDTIPATLTFGSGDVDVTATVKEP